MDTSALLHHINAQHGTAFVLGSKFAGGYQGGAHELVDPATSRRAVLKRAWVPRAVPIVEQLRAKGYPTPAWLCCGVAPDNTPYVVQAYMPGTPMGRLTEAYLNQVFALNDLQADLRPAPASDDGTEGRYAHDVVFAGGSGWAANIRAYSPDAARLLAALETVVRPYAAVQLPYTDAVHGDFTPTTCWWKMNASPA